MGMLTRVQNSGKFGKAKNVQNSARFRTTFDFDCKYLGNGLRYRQAVNGLSTTVPSALNKKIDELWSTNHEVVFAHFDLPRIDSAHVFWPTFDFDRGYLLNE